MEWILESVTCLEAALETIIKQSQNAELMNSPKSFDGLDKKARLNVNAFFERDAKFLEVFEKYKSVGLSGEVGISRGDFLNAMQEANAFIEVESVDEIFEIFDINQNKVLEKNEFLQAVNKPSKIEQWVSSLPFGSLVANVLAVLVPTEELLDKNSLKVLSECSEENLQQVCVAIGEGIFRLMRDGIHTLQNALTAQDCKPSLSVSAESGSKFTVGVMNCGNIEHFFQGLTSLVGFPNLQFLKGMKEEHCSRADSDTLFITSNYGLETCPREEWRIVIEADQSKTGERRRVPDYRVLVAELEQESKVSLRDCEILAIILYTGPMFQIFNAVLRSVLVSNAVAPSKNNTYATTIHCLVSAVTKISRVTHVPAGTLLYRGIGGIELPSTFYRRAAVSVSADGESDVCASEYLCFVEMGFMSTTCDRATAIHYTGVARGRAIPTLLQVRTAAVDHGADIGRFSQYPQEKEFLWNPLSLVEPLGNASIEATPHGIVRVFPVRMNLNVKCLTVEELENQKKTMHLSAFRYLLNETELELRKKITEIEEHAQSDPAVVHDSRESAAQRLVDNILDQCHVVLDKHQHKDNQEFLEGPAFRSLVIEMLDVVLFAQSKVNHYLLDKSVKMHLLVAAPLRTAHRRYVAFLERIFARQWPNWCPPPPPPGEPDPAQEQAWRLCLAKGLISRPLEQMRGSNALDELNELGEPRMVSGAAEGLNSTALKLLVAARANVNAIDTSGTTAIMRAATSGNERVLRVLATDLEADSHKKKKKNGNTALILAAREGHIGCVHVLLNELRANPFVANTNGYTALMGAAENGHVDCIRLIAEAMKRKADAAEAAGGKSEGLGVNDAVTKDGMTALRYAAKYGFAACIEELVRFNASVDRPALIIARFCHRGASDSLACLSTLAERFWSPKPGDAVLVPLNGVAQAGKVCEVDQSRYPLMVEFPGAPSSNGWFSRKAVQRDPEVALAAEAGLAPGVRVHLSEGYRKDLMLWRTTLGTYLHPALSGTDGTSEHPVLGVIEKLDPPNEEDRCVRAAVGQKTLRLFFVRFEGGADLNWMGVDAWYMGEEIVVAAA